MENNNLTTSIIEYIETQCGNTITESVINKYKTDIQRIIKEEIVNVRMHLEQSLNEDLSIPVNIGDVVLMGKFKNKRVVVKSITKNEKGDYLINGKPAFKFRLLKEMSRADLNYVDAYADRKMGTDVVLTDKHFFDRVNDPRNKKEILDYELMDFFDKLSDDKERFIKFLKKYKQVVVVDTDTDINIPFMKQANLLIAKTIMRKWNFKTSDVKFKI